MQNLVTQVLDDHLQERDTRFIFIRTLAYATLKKIRTQHRKWKNERDSSDTQTHLKIVD